MQHWGSAPQTNAGRGQEYPAPDEARRWNASNARHAHQIALLAGKPAATGSSESRVDRLRGMPATTYGNAIAKLTHHCVVREVHDE